MKLPFAICILVLLTSNLASQETFLKEYSEGNFIVNPWIIEEGPNGPLVCGFKSRENPDRGYFFCDGYDKNGFKINSDSILFNNEVLFFGNLDNRPTKIDDSLYWFKRSYDNYIILGIDLSDASINLLDTLNFSDSGFVPEHMHFISQDNYIFTGYIIDSTQAENISQFAVVKISNQDANVIVEKQVDNIQSIGKRIQSVRNDTIRIFSQFIKGIYSGYEINTFDINLNKVDSIRIEFLDPQLGIIFDAVEDSEGNNAFVGWASEEFLNNVFFVSKDGSTYWDLKIGYNLNAESSSRISTIIESNENDGFIYAGSDLTLSFELDSSFSYAVIGKVSKEGISQWYRKYKIDNSSSGKHKFIDVVSTFDGSGYYLVGEMFDPNPVPEPVRLILAKVDSEGLIDGYTNVEQVLLTETEIFEAHPSPFKDHILIRQKEPGDIIFRIYNAGGQLVQEIQSEYQGNQMLIETNDFPKGVYYIKSYLDGVESQVEKIMKTN